MNQQIFRLALVAALCMFIGSNADASLVSHTSQAAWTSATVSPTTIDFESLAFTGPLTYLPGPTIIDQINFGSNLYSNNQIFATGKYLMSGSTAMVIATKPGTVSAASNYMAYYGNFTVFTITAYSNMSAAVSLVHNPGVGLGYFGFTATEPGEYITQIVGQQTSGLNYTAVDNFAYSTTPPSSHPRGAVRRAGPHDDARRRAPTPHRVTRRSTDIPTTPFSSRPTQVPCTRFRPLSAATR